MGCAAVMDRAASMCLLPQEEVSMSDDDTILRTLCQCVEAWEGVWSVMQSASRPVSMETLFHRPTEMLEHVLLTALVCHAHLQVYM